MMHAIVTALLCSALLAAPASAEERKPTAIELAGSVAACMTFSRTYPDGQGVVAHGTICEAELLEDGEVFATVARALGEPGYHALEIVPIEAPARGPLWN